MLQDRIARSLKRVLRTDTGKSLVQRLNHAAGVANERPDTQPGERTEEPTYSCVTIQQTSGKAFNMLLARPGFVEDKIAKGKPWEENIASLCCFFMRDNALYVDVGANIGYHSLRVAALFSGATCVCFEPHPLLYTQLLQNLAVNSTIQNLRAHNLAVGERSGDVEFYLQRPESYNRGLSSIMPNADLAGAYEKRRVKIVALDDFFADDTKSQIAVMKIDVQGYEAQVIVGARETIQCSRPVIIFEFEANYHGQQAVTVFESILQQLVNYSVFLVKSRAAEFYRSFAVADVCQAGFEGNFLCLPQEVYRF